MTLTLVPISKTKPIFEVAEDATLFAKGGVSKREIELQKYAAALEIAPPIVSILKRDGKDIIVMRKIKGQSIADFYGTNEIPTHIWSQIHAHVQLMWNHGIEYIDITPYNFILETETGKVWAVDFGHARKIRMNWFLKDILSHPKMRWTPDFE